MYEIDNQKFGEFVAALRKEKGYTQKELAEKLFLSDKAISKWERGLEFYDLRGKDYDDPQWDKLDVYKRQSRNRDCIVRKLCHRRIECRTSDHLQYEAGRFHNRRTFYRADRHGRR